MKAGCRQLLAGSSHHVPGKQPSAVPGVPRMRTAPTPALPLQPSLATQWEALSYIPYFIVWEGSVGTDKDHTIAFEDLGKHEGFLRDLLKATWQACASTEDLFLTVPCVAWDHQASCLYATKLRASADPCLWSLQMLAKNTWHSSSSGISVSSPCQGWPG